MNRTIKFRGRRLDKSDWVYGDLEIRRATGRTFIHTYNDDGTYNKQYEVDPETVGQFTGLYDKPGNEIYEGDIVDAWSAGHHTTCGIIRYKPPRFFIGLFDKKRKEYYDSWSLSPNAFGKDELLEVIGNVHDNPELLNGTS